MNSFTEDQKKWNVIAYGAYLWQLWGDVSLKKYSIVGRKKEKYRLQYYAKVIEHFSDAGSVLKKKRDRQSSKLAGAKVFVQSELESSNQVSVRKVARKLDLSSCTAYRAMKLECKLKIDRKFSRIITNGREWILAGGFWIQTLMYRKWFSQTRIFFLWNQVLIAKAQGFGALKIHSYVKSPSVNVLKSWWFGLLEVQRHIYWLKATIFRQDYNLLLR